MANIHGLTSTDTLGDGDEIPLYSQSAGGTRKATLGQVSGLFIDRLTGIVDDAAAEFGRKLAENVSIYDSGVVADGNGLGGGTDQTGKFQAAGDALAAAGGGTLRIPRAGTGVIRLDGQINAWANVAIVIDDGMTLDFTNKSTGSAALYWSGSMGAEIPLAANVTRGDTVISTNAPHGLVAGDWALLKSQRAALHADAGADWRLGTPTSGEPTYFAEPVQVDTVQSATQFTATNKLIFPTYRTDRTLETYVGTRVSTVAKMNFLRGASLKGGKFVGGGVDVLRFNLCFEPVAIPCDIDLRNVTGAAVRLESCLRGKVKASARHDHDFQIIADHSNYNSFKDVGAWWCEWDIRDFYGSQGMDVSYYAGGHPSIMPTITGAAYDQKETGVTFHGGSYGGVIDRFRAYRCKQSGIYNRSRFVSIFDPYISGLNDPTVGGGQSGIYLEGWSIDCHVEGGYVEGYGHALVSIIYSTDPSPTQRNQRINGLTVRRCNDGVYLRTTSAGLVNSDPSGITITNCDFDQMRDYAIRIEGYVNFVTVRNIRVGTLTKASDGIGIYVQNNAVGTKIRGIEGTNVGALNYLIRTFAIDDLTTFPAAQYPRNLTEVDDYRLTGTGIALSLEAGNVNTVSSGSYTLKLFDQDQPIFASTANAKTIVVPAEATAPFKRGAQIKVVQTGTVSVTFSPDTGVTLSSRNGLKTGGQYAVAILTKIAANQWVLSGDTAV